MGGRGRYDGFLPMEEVGFEATPAMDGRPGVVWAWEPPFAVAALRVASGLKIHRRQLCAGRSRHRQQPQLLRGTSALYSKASAVLRRKSRPINQRIASSKNLSTKGTAVMGLQARCVPDQSSADCMRYY